MVGGTGRVLTMKSMKNMKAGPFDAFAGAHLLMAGSPAPPEEKRGSKGLMVTYGREAPNMKAMKENPDMKPMKEREAGPFGAFACGSLAHDKQPRTPGFPFFMV
jgi:hypothetical protein